MSTAASRAISSVKSSESEKIIGFTPSELKAPFMLRCAALCIDYIVLLTFPVAALALSIVLSETTADIGVGPAAWIIGIVLFLINSLLLPMLRGQTVGKMVFGLTIVKANGSAIGVADVIKRNIGGYLVTLLTLGIGFLMGAVNKSGMALHDMLAGTVVVRARKKQV